LEISGGNYEQMSMVGIESEEEQKTEERKLASTVAREAYFLEFAEKVRPLIDMPLMITGGMRNVTTMEKALKSGACQLIGVGRPFCYAPEDCGRILKDGGADSLPTIEQGLSMERGALGADVAE